MVDLDREVRNWAESVHAERCNPEASVSELIDHLHCEIERLRADGLSADDAFRAATARLGPSTALSAEHAKNRSVFGTVCQAAAKVERADPAQRPLLVAHATMWASLILGSSLILSRSSASVAASLLLMLLFIPLWWASDQLLRKAMRHRNA